MKQLIGITLTLLFRKRFFSVFCFLFFSAQLGATPLFSFVNLFNKIPNQSASKDFFVLQHESQFFQFDSIKSGSISELLSLGDKKFEAMDYPTAISLCEKALSIEPNNAEVLWRLARLYVCTGDVTEDKDREVYYIKASEYARQSIAQSNTSGKCHTWYGAALGNLAIYRGSRDKVKLSLEIKMHIEKAIQMDPNDDIAYSILGSFYTALGNVNWIERQLANVFLGGLPEGGFDDAEKAYNKAIKLAPTILRHHFELGLLYLDWGKDQEAYSVFLKASQLKPQMLSDLDRINRIKEYLKSLKP